jgi:hypothetical protein
MFADLHFIGDACLPSARVLAIGCRESLPETTETVRTICEGSLASKTPV